jgi:hypothetical protein
MEYCGSGVCNPPRTLIYEANTLYKNMSSKEVGQLLINVYTGRSLVYPDYYFITRYISPDNYEVIPIYDPYPYQVTQRVQYIYNLINYKRSYNLPNKYTFTVTQAELNVIKNHVFDDHGIIEPRKIYSNSLIAVIYIPNGLYYDIVIVQKSKIAELYELEEAPEECNPEPVMTFNSIEEIESWALHSGKVWRVVESGNVLKLVAHDGEICRSTIIYEDGIYKYYEC